MKPTVRTESSCRDLSVDRSAFDAWAARWRERAEGSDDHDRPLRMNRVNPRYILRGHLAESATRQALERDYRPVRRLLNVLERAYDEQSGFEDLMALPANWAAGLEVTCSS